ncbi:MAG: hypothetical protein WCL61_03620 [bacterium]
MFDQVPKLNNPVPSKTVEPPLALPQIDDIFSSKQPLEINKLNQVVTPKAVNQIPPVIANNPSVFPIDTDELYGGKAFWQSSVIISILSVVLLGVLITGMVFGYKALKASDQVRSNFKNILSTTGATSTKNGATTKVATSTNKANVNQVATNGNTATTTAIVEPVLVDSDHDGLSDVQEKQLGTNPNDPDTDHDGLMDGAEVNGFHTDPKNADTDGDGYKDGAEVINGYDPLKPGTARLLKIPGL